MRHYQNINGAKMWCTRYGATVIPVSPENKRSMCTWDNAVSDPDEAEQLFDAYSTPNEIPLIGIITSPSDKVVFDFDKKSRGLETYTQMCQVYPELKETYTESTRSGGLHVFFKANGQYIKNGYNAFMKKIDENTWDNRLDGRDWPGVDTRGHGGLCVVAPSKDDKGEYKALNDKPIQPISDSLINLLRQVGKVLDADSFDKDDRDSAYNTIEAAPIPVRFYREQHNPPCIKNILTNLRAGKATNDENFALLCYYLGLNLSENDITAIFGRSPRFKRDITEYQVKVASQRGYKCLRCATMQDSGLCPSDSSCNGEKSPAWNYRYSYYVRNWPYDDAKDEKGTADMLADIYSDDIRYVKGAKRWFVWNGTYWPEDIEERHLSQMVTSIADLVMDRVLFLSCFTKDIAESEIKKAHAKMVENQYRQYHKMRNVSTIKNIILMASKVVNKIVLDDMDYLDKDKHLFPLLNGVYNADTDELIPHGEATKSFIRTYLYPVALNRQAKCPNYDRFMDELTCGDKELAKEIDKWSGYCLSGFTNEQEFRIYSGAGANGKSVEAEVMRGLMGAGAATASSTAFTLSRGGSNGRFSFARLRGVRLLICSEVAEGQMFNAEKVKAFTGGEKINAEEKYQSEFEYTPEAKATFLFNHIPTAKKDRAMERRLWVIPFNYNVDLDKLDKNLKNKLLQELEGILNRKIEGYKLWRKDSFTNKCKAVIDATNAYWAEADYLAAFLTDECNIGKDKSTGKKYEALPDELYKRFNEWRLSHESEDLSQIAFSRKINSLGFTLGTRYSDTEKDEKGKPKQYRVREGIQLKPFVVKIEGLNHRVKA